MDASIIAKHFRTYITAFAAGILMIKLFFFIEGFGPYLMNEATPVLNIIAILLSITVIICIYIGIFYYMDKFFQGHYRKTRLMPEDIQILKVIGILVAAGPFPQAGLEHMMDLIVGNNVDSNLISIVLKFNYLTFAIGAFLYAAAYVTRDN